jgi:hypothetical protein
MEFFSPIALGAFFLSLVCAFISIVPPESPPLISISNEAFQHASIMFGVISIASTNFMRL